MPDLVLKKSDFKMTDFYMVTTNANLCRPNNCIYGYTGPQTPSRGPHVENLTPFRDLSDQRLLEGYFYRQMGRDGSQAASNLGNISLGGQAFSVRHPPWLWDPP